MVRGKPFLIRMIGGLFKPRARIVGGDIAGTIEAIGTDVRSFRVGDEVYGDLCEQGFGGFAEERARPGHLPRLEAGRHDV